MVSICEKHLYIKNIDYVKNVNIVEYDMSQAGFSIITKYRLLPDTTISMLNDISDKKHRNIRIGLYMRQRPGLGASINDYIKQERIAFAEANELADNDIFAIRKDAIFLVNRTPAITSMDEFIVFKPKSRYSSFIKINNYEFYYNNRDDTLDIKNMRNESRPLHENHWFAFIKTLLRISENANQYNVYLKLKQFRHTYLSYELDADFYREFNDESKYRMITGLTDYTVLLDNVGLSYIRDMIDIKYNISIISKLSKILI